MRALTATVLALAATAALGACGRQKAPGEAVSTPIARAAETERRPGLWEQRVSDGETVAATRMCLDAAHELMLSDFGRRAGARCRTNEMREEAPGKWRYLSVCDLGAAGRVTTAGTVTGDFRTRYRITAETSTAGQDGRRRLVVDAAWQGPCPAGMSPGDVVLPDGRRARVSDLTPSEGL